MAKKTSKIDMVKVSSKVLSSRELAQAYVDQLSKELDSTREALAGEINARRKAESREQEVGKMLGIERTTRMKATNDLGAVRHDANKLGASYEILAHHAQTQDDVILNLRNQNADLVRALVKLALKIV